VWLIKPNLFNSAGFVSDAALNGFTKISIDGATQTLAHGAAIPRGATVLESVAPVVKNAVFSHRLALGVAGGVTGAYFANRAVMAEGKDRRKFEITAAAIGAATLGGIAAMPLLTRGASTIGLNAVNDHALFWKPNSKMVKEVAVKVIMPTAGTAGFTAYNFMDALTDFGKVLKVKSPFEDGK
jgi:hypothetical protein